MKRFRPQKKNDDKIAADASATTTLPTATKRRPSTRGFSGAPLAGSEGVGFSFEEDPDACSMGEATLL